LDEGAKVCRLVQEGAGVVESDFHQHPVVLDEEAKACRLVQEGAGAVELDFHQHPTALDEEVKACRLAQEGAGVVGLDFRQHPAALDEEEGACRLVQEGADVAGQGCLQRLQGEGVAAFLLHLRIPPLGQVFRIRILDLVLGLVKNLFSAAKHQHLQVHSCDW